MDKNSIIGFVLIGVLLLVYTIMNQPTQEELNNIKRQQDSIAQAKKLEKQSSNQNIDEDYKVTGKDSINNTSSSISNVKKEYFTLENNLIKIKVSNHGGGIHSVELKKYRSFNKKDLILWEGDHNKFGLLMSQNGNVINTQTIAFSATINNDNTLMMSAHTPTNGVISYKYSLTEDSYEVGFEISVSKPNGQIDFLWSENMIPHEQSRSFEERYTTVYYKEQDGDVNSLSASAKTDEATPEKKIKWVGLKSRFFSSVLINKKGVFSRVTVNSKNFTEDSSPYLKNLSSKIGLDFNNTTTIPLKFFFGPNDYKLLRKYGKDIELQNLISLGWGPFGWINRFAIIEIFDFLQKYVTQNYGIIILILTIIIKLILSPLTYKSYISSAKMRVLKPQVEEINKRIPKDKAMERQQATMALYRKAGVNPLGGCIPMIVQMPILFAMFYFFPVAIQLRQKSFLWAEDLSSYDSIASLSFEIPFYGDHVSLFCLLMAATNLIYTYINMQNQPSSSQPGMPNMKFIMYLTPFIFLGVFNQYPSGLSYYYFIATLFTIVQTIIIRKYMIDDKKLLAKLEENKAKPTKPKSKFRQRLEEMQKEQNRRARRK